MINSRYISPSFYTHIPTTNGPYLAHEGLKWTVLAQNNTN